MKIKSADIFLILGILALSVAAIIIMPRILDNGVNVVVLIDGERIGCYQLDKDMTAVIVSPEDEEKVNTLVISDGKAYIKDASCPDGYCEKHRPISLDGETIVCLPHKLIIMIEGGSSDSVDIIS